MSSVIAIDLGASSGRVMVGTLRDAKISLYEVHRFANSQTMIHNQSCWDLYTILEEIDAGITKVISGGTDAKSLGIDTWGVDFVLLDQYGKHLGEFVSYRDARTEGLAEAILKDNGLTKETIYHTTGIQFLPFNTIYQLKAISEQQPEWFSRIDKLLFIPDYLNYKLCGVQHCEYTNASTSQLLNCKTKTWSAPLIEACGAKPEWFLPPQMPGKIIGHYTRDGIHIPVCSVASHDTASAVAAAPLHENNAYLSSGTWSLMGIESLEPYTSELACQYNITNEGGMESRFRVLKNIMGLWIIQRLRAENPSLNFADIGLLARHAEPFRFLLNPNDEAFFNPPSMTDAIRQWFSKRALPVPDSFSQIVRCVYDSLALAYAHTLENLTEVSGQPINTIRIVGGGTQDALLCQLCADVCEIPVVTEPTEASALGNVICQFIALNEISDLSEARSIIENSSYPRCCEPQFIAGLSEIKQMYKSII